MFTKGKLKDKYLMDQEKWFMQMGTHIRATLKKVFRKDKVKCNTPMEIFIKDNF